MTTWTYGWHLKGAEPLTCGRQCCPCMDSVRIELNYGTPSWCPEQHLLVCPAPWPPPHTHIQWNLVPLSPFRTSLSFGHCHNHFPHLHPSFCFWLVMCKNFDSVSEGRCQVYAIRSCQVAKLNPFLMSWMSFIQGQAVHGLGECSASWAPGLSS